MTTTKTAVASQTPIDFPVWKTIKVGTFKSMDDAENALRAAKVLFEEFGSVRPLLRHPMFKLEMVEREIDLIKVTGEELGVESEVFYSRDLHTKIGGALRFCPDETAFQLRLQYLDQPESEKLVIYSQPFPLDDTDSLRGDWTCGGLFSVNNYRPLPISSGRLVQDESGQVLKLPYTLNLGHESTGQYKNMTLVLVKPRREKWQ